MQLARLAWIVAIATHPQDCYLDKGHAGETSGFHGYGQQVSLSPYASALFFLSLSQAYK